jgi:hypothetical protein
MVAFSLNNRNQSIRIPFSNKKNIAHPSLASNQNPKVRRLVFRDFAGLSLVYLYRAHLLADPPLGFALGCTCDD